MPLPEPSSSYKGFAQDFRWSDVCHEIAAKHVYPTWWRGWTWSYSKQAADYLGVDRIATYVNEFGSFREYVAERFRGRSYLNHRDITLRVTGERSMGDRDELGKSAATRMVYAYMNQDRPSQKRPQPPPTGVLYAVQIDMSCLRALYRIRAIRPTDIRENKDEGSNLLTFSFEDLDRSGCMLKSWSAPMDVLAAAEASGLHRVPR